MLYLVIYMMKRESMSSPIVSAPRNQTNPDVARLPNGGYIAVWEAPGADSAVYLRLLDANGAPVGSEMLVAANIKGGNALPSVTVADNGNVLVSWSVRDTQTVQGNGIFARIFDISNNSPRGLTGNFPIASVAKIGEQLTNVDIAATGNDFVAIWEYSDRIVGNIQMSTIRYGSSSGSTPLVSNSVIVSDFATVYTHNGGNPAVAAGGGLTAVAWRTHEGTGAGSDIAVTVYDASGHSGTTNTLNHRFSEDNPAIAYIGNGKFAVVWSGYADANRQNDLYGTTIDAQGIQAGPYFEIASTPGVSEGEVDIQATGDGFIVNWAVQGKEGGQHVDIFARRFDMAGNPTSDIIAIATSNDYFRSNPALATDASGNAVIVWQETVPNSNNWDMLLSSLKSGLTDDDLFRVTADGTTLAYLGATPGAGTPGTQQFTGSSRSEIIVGTRAVDAIDGGGGIDVLRVGASLSSVQVTRGSDYWAVTTQTLMDATTDYVRNVEALLGTDGVRLLTAPADFESAYRARNPDVAAAIDAGTLKSGLEHWLAYGRSEGRIGPSIFDEDFYLARNPDVATAVLAGVFASGQAHWTLYGRAEGRSPSALFDADYYLAKNTDVAGAVARHEVTALDHFWTYGMTEKRAASPLFDPQAYLAANPGVTVSGLNVYQHFSLYGWKAGQAITVYDHEFLI